jgi:hypothetical protein
VKFCVNTNFQSGENWLSIINMAFKEIQFYLLIHIKYTYNIIQGAYHEKSLLIRPTLNIDDELIQKASKLTGIAEKTALARLGLQSLIALESGKRLAKLGGTERKLMPISRRRRSSLRNGAC